MKSVTQTSNALAQGSATQRQSPLALSLSLSPRAAQPPPASAVRGADGKGQYNHFHSPSTRCGCCELWNGLAVAKKHSWGRWMTSVKRLTAHIITQKIKTCFTRTLKPNPKRKSQRRFCDSIHSKNLHGLCCRVGWIATAHAHIRWPAGGFHGLWSLTAPLPVSVTERDYYVTTRGRAATCHPLSK